MNSEFQANPNKTIFRYIPVCYREADDGQLDAFIEEVQQEGRMTGETKILLEKLDETPKPKEERKPTVI